MTAIAVTVRLLVLLLVSWLLVGFATPTGDPFAVNVVWLAMIALALSIPVSRRVTSHWISTGRLSHPAERAK
jgi:hypothetical protein